MRTFIPKAQPWRQRTLDFSVIAGHPRFGADATLWPLSDRASYVTGAPLDVGGGR